MFFYFRIIFGQTYYGTMVSLFKIYTLSRTQNGVTEKTKYLDYIGPADINYGDTHS